MYPTNTQKLLAHLPAMAGMLRRAAVDAGAVIMSHYDPSGFRGDIAFKPDDSPVTAADLEADGVIRDFLIENFPGIPVITEETADAVDHDLLRRADHYWLVDPLDGTRAFRRGERDFTVNIALIHHQDPILGVMYAPALGEGYVGIMGETRAAFRWRDDLGQEAEISVRGVPHAGLTVLTSQTGSPSAYTRALIDQIKINKHIKRSSSIKYAEVAAGRADLVVTTRNMRYWDTAAGDAIIRAAGGRMVRLDGRAVTYDRTVPDLANRGLIACGDLDYFQPVLDELNNSDYKASLA